jgi:hypothetical protein
MSMSQDSQDFKSLRQLLALKRHEQPPPGYFNDFSSQVIARIKADDRGDESYFERLFWEAPWLQRLWAALETKPIITGAFGAAVCALLIGGVIYSDSVDVQPVVGGPDTAVTLPMQIADASALAQPTLESPAPTGFSGATALPESMAAAASVQGIFGLVPRPKAQAASVTLSPLSLPGGN